MTITAAPTVPNPNSATFAADAYPFTQWMAALGPEIDAAVVSMNAAAVSSLLGVTTTSSTSLTLGAATHALTVEASKGFVPGMALKIARTSSPTTTFMAGTVSTYNASTGAISVIVEASGVTGSGTFTDWTISISLPSSSDMTPTGTVIIFGKNAAPSGYLKANGALVSRTTYSDLFIVIGTTFGVGDGSTTFALPDLRGEFIRGWADDRAVDTGRVFGSAQAADLISHTHSFSAAISGSTGASNNSSSFIGPSSSTTGATGGTETRPRNIALLACIKY